MEFEFGASRLSHTSCLFNSSYFGDRVVFFSQAGLDCDPLILLFLGFPQCLSSFLLGLATN
jgi:hypothetical protein